MILADGSNISIFYKRSIPLGSRLLTYLLKGTGYHLGKVGLKSGKADTPGQTDSFGVPIILNILKI